MKRMSALCALAIAVASLAPVTSTAAERPTSVKGCAKPTAKAHVPATLKQPTSVDKKLAKTMTITTNCGVITIELDPAAPQTVTNLATLARSKYFDGSFCHRLTTEGIYVLQCGDPSAQGNGSPGSWKGYKDENLPTKKILTYPAGTVAMANSGPNTNGSQFFLVYKDTTLPPSYTIWGKIKTGLPLLLRIEKVGAYQVDQSTGNAYYAGDGIPVQPIEIKSVTVR
ncbi:peptidyl-prolyl cis-trans isomerase B (cyclophilin B) [Candidatus Planktophila lacus]|uniref:peptidylprolyl isomerase n=1 Tax=Candidatus Planktophila lacus TaxID=1884913 RepID=UPI000BACDAB3|nr:peptidylprolyl isomerase [Candidatus Planktophila lacus]ASY29396.1 peptidyl-prolyl cis-trans isomerase B (cyclophilin B) [Candidatus Planktophila lacus]